MSAENSISDKTTLKDLDRGVWLFVPLPCAKNCRFGRKCEEQYYINDDCAEVIHRVIKDKVGEKTSDPLSLDYQGHLGFRSSDPDGQGFIIRGRLQANWGVDFP